MLNFIFIYIGFLVLVAFFGFIACRCVWGRCGANAKNYTRHARTKGILLGFFALSGAILIAGTVLVGTGNQKWYTNSKDSEDTLRTESDALQSSFDLVVANAASASD